MTLALIAGNGRLPQALVNAVTEAPYIACLEGFAPEGLAVNLVFRLERLYPFFASLHAAGVTQICFAGAVSRPRLDPALFDTLTASIVPRLMASMAAGDDATLREIIALFEEDGFEIVGAHDIAPSLLPAAGVLAGSLPPHAEKDAARAARVTEALGRVDVGQGCVIEHGICLAAESIGGTDRMLATVANLPEGLRAPLARGRGLLYKAPKPLQDRRFDLPTLGLDSVQRAHEAGLSGIVFEAGGVICLDLEEMRAAAEALGLYLWAREGAA